MRSHVLGSLPCPAQVVVGLFIYRRAMYTLHGQGTARFSADEVAAFRREVWEAVDVLLRAAKSKSASRSADEPFWILGGEGPTEADTVAFGFIVSALICSAYVLNPGGYDLADLVRAPDSNEAVRSFPAVLDYASRIHDRYFPDYERWD